ncbi:MAG: serine/threonine-protein kinase [Myxococcales bacterium]
MSVKPDAAPENLGPYRCLRKLAVGGMGEVYLAEARGAAGFVKRLVIKAVRPDRAEEQEVVQAFLDEARVWALLTHPNIVPLYDCAWLEGRLCLVMEYVEGADLRELIQSASRLHRPVPGAVAVHLTAQIASALHAAHEARGLDGVPLGIVHRDVSPHNVLVDRAGGARLCDFGIARSVLRLTRTRTGKFKGKFAYVSPEAIRGETVDRRADVFGLGVLLYELLALRRPFAADSPVALLRTILDTEPPAIREVRRDASVRLAHAIERALAKEAQARFPTCEALRQALLETPEGQAFLPVSRLTEWFDGLTGMEGDWHETQPRFLDLAARSAARSIDDDLDAEGTLSSSEEPQGPLVPFDVGEDRTEPAAFLRTKLPPGLPKAGGAIRGSPTQKEPLGPPAGLPDEEPTHVQEPSVSVPTAPSRPKASPGPLARRPPAVAPAVAVPWPPPRPRPSLLREYAPWIVGGLVTGAAATALIWRLL